jgi:hypothetical protein
VARGEKARSPRRSTGRACAGRLPRDSPGTRAWRLWCRGRERRPRCQPPRRRQSPGTTHQSHRRNITASVIRAIPRTCGGTAAYAGARRGDAIVILAEIIADEGDTSARQESSRLVRECRGAWRGRHRPRAGTVAVLERVRAVIASATLLGHPAIALGVKPEPSGGR